MSRLFTLIIAFYVSMLTVGCATHTDLGPPSEGARGMPGALGTFAFNPKPPKPGTTTYWIDSDGVLPGVAGCHRETDGDGVTLKDGRHFGEMCLDKNRLVESNPGVDVKHDHANDTGHPDQFSCKDWCIGEGASGGSCVVVDPIPPCSSESPFYKTSAMCSCDKTE